jgi:hypothetical protein
MKTSPTQYVVMIEGEDFPDLIGPFRSEGIATEVADRWNREHDTDRAGKAWVMPLRNREWATK